MKGISKYFGCRSPNSKGVGCWDGAFVWVKSSDGKEVLGVFDNNMDHIGYPTEEQAKKEYDKYIKKGWKPMSEEDIKLTAGVG